MNKILKAAVIGTGAISKEHFQYLNSRSHKNTPVKPEVVGVCDLSPATANYAAKQFSTKPFTDYETMLKETEPDVVHVLTPPHTHLSLSKLALENGAHVICEKPITSNSKDLQKLFEIADRHKRHIIESHNYKFNDQIQEMLSASKRGQLGSIREVEIRISLDVTDPSGRFGDPNIPSPIHQMPAGVIHDFTTHFTYLLLALTGNATFETVSAIWRNHSNNPIFKYDNLDATLVGKNPEGAVHARLRFDTETPPDSFGIIVRGTTGYMETDLFHPYIRTVVPRAGGSQLTPIVNHIANGASLTKAGFSNFKNKLLQNSPYHGLHIMLGKIYASLATESEPPITRQEMLGASALVDQLLSEEAMR